MLRYLCRECKGELFRLEISEEFKVKNSLSDWGLFPPKTVKNLLKRCPHCGAEIVGEPIVDEISVKAIIGRGT